MPAKCWLATGLAVLMAFPPGIWAQAPAPPTPVQAPASTPAAGQAQPASLPTVQDLRVVALSGNGGVNDLERKVMTPVAVQVLDQDGRPVVGADVVFRFPLRPPTAVFGNGLNVQTTRTNVDGQAAAANWMASGAGTFQVQVAATRGNELGQVTITMTNATRVIEGEKTKGKSWWSHKWAKIGVIGGAAGLAAIIAVVLTRGKGTTTVTATPGTPTIGAPQ